MQLQLNPQLLLQLNGGTGSQNVIQNLVAISSEHFGDLMGTLLHKNKFIIPKKNVIQLELRLRGYSSRFVILYIVNL